jgi:peptidoglycan L-alanyl-D-glutamate endopeptidase CwlK
MSMPVFSQTSKDRLATCDARLQRVFTEVIRHFDCTVIVGHRGEKAQNEAFATGKTQLKFPSGKHNAMPSKACDVVPAPVDWTDSKRFYYFAGFVMAIAKSMGIKLRFGGDWNRDTQLKDNKFNDLVHFEIDE